MPYRLAIAHRQEMIIRDLYTKSKYFFENFIIKFSVYKQHSRKRPVVAKQRAFAVMPEISIVSAEVRKNVFSLQTEDQHK